MDFAAIAAAMEMKDTDNDSGSFKYSQEGDDEQPDEDFGTIIELPFPEHVFEKTYKGLEITNCFLGQYDDNDCKTCLYPFYMLMKSDYTARFKLSRITLEDQGKFLNVTGLDFFPCDLESNMMDSLLFRKDGKETRQPVKVRYEGEEAQLSENTNTCWMALAEDGIQLKRRCDVSGEETLDVFIKWNWEEKQLYIENTRITSSDRTRNELFGLYTIAKFSEQKNKAFLDEDDYADNLIP